MTKISPLENIHKKGLFGDYAEKAEKDLIKISEVKDLLIVQIIQYENSLFPLKNINIDGLKLDENPLEVKCNNNTRILWQGPKSWILTSTKKNLYKDMLTVFNKIDFAITDLSNSKTIIEVEGRNSKEILKGSARSVYKYNIGSAIKNSLDKDLIISGGGHNMAAGFTLKKKKSKKL